MSFRGSDRPQVTNAAIQGDWKDTVFFAIKTRRQILLPQRTEKNDDDQGKVSEGVRECQTEVIATDITFCGVYLCPSEL